MPMVLFRNVMPLFSREAIHALFSSALAEAMSAEIVFSSSFTCDCASFLLNVSCLFMRVMICWCSSCSCVMCGSEATRSSAFCMPVLIVSFWRGV